MSSASMRVSTKISGMKASWVQGFGNYFLELLFKKLHIAIPKSGGPAGIFYSRQILFLYIPHSLLKHCTHQTLFTERADGLNLSPF